MRIASHSAHIGATERATPRRPAPERSARPEEAARSDKAQPGAQADRADAEAPPLVGATDTEATSGDSASGDSKSLGGKSADDVVWLQQRDAQVRAHEAAHMAAAGSLGGGASYTYETGSDGRRYAVGGEVPIQISTGHTPEETIRNAEQVRAAALAPADPSGQDLAVASEAAQMEAGARAEQARQATEALKSPNKTESKPADGAPTAKNMAAPVGFPASTKAGATVAEKPPAPAAASASSSTTNDPAATLTQLETEQRTARGEWQHFHQEAACPNCARAASAYAGS